jgi:hypothetical protein
MRARLQFSVTFTTFSLARGLVAILPRFATLRPPAKRHLHATVPPPPPQLAQQQYLAPGADCRQAVAARGRAGQARTSSARKNIVPGAAWCAPAARPHRRTRAEHGAEQACTTRPHHAPALRVGAAAARVARGCSAHPQHAVGGAACSAQRGPPARAGVAVRRQRRVAGTPAPHCCRTRAPHVRRLLPAPRYATLLYAPARHCGAGPAARSRRDAARPAQRQNHASRKQRTPAGSVVSRPRTPTRHAAGRRSRPGLCFFFALGRTRSRLARARVTATRPRPAVRCVTLRALTPLASARHVPARRKPTPPPLAARAGFAARNDEHDGRRQRRR